MALIEPTLASNALRLTAPRMPELRLKLPADGARHAVRIWQDQVIAIDQGAEAAEWLGDVLGRTCRLVRMPDDGVRPVDRKFATRPTDQVAFADGYPLLLVSQESLDDLNARLAIALPMNRFRPNVVISGQTQPYAEDAWAEIRIGEVRLSLVKACARCVITTTDQATAERGAEPLLSLARYRRVDRGVLFGQNLIPATNGRIAIDQEVVASSPAQNEASSQAACLLDGLAYNFSTHRQ